MNEIFNHLEPRPQEVRARSAVVRIDFDRLTANLDALRQAAYPREVLVVLKNDAYGHGLIAVARHLQAQDVRNIAVGCVDEGRRLREGGYEWNILVLGPTRDDELSYALDYKLDITITDAEHFDEISTWLEAAQSKIKAHLKINTGLGRYGFDPDANALAHVVKSQVVEICGVFSHLARPDGANASSIASQFEALALVQQWLIERGHKDLRFHLSSSSAVLLGTPDPFDCVRVGIGLFGVYPDAASRQSKTELMPVKEVQSYIYSVQDLSAGTKIGYSRWMLERDTRVGIVPFGYADGLPRSVASKGFVLIDGALAKILGEVSGNSMMVDVTDIPGAARDMPVTIMGAQGNNSISADDLAEWCVSLNTELLVNLGRPK